MLQLMNSVNNIAKRILSEHINTNSVNSETMQVLNRRNFILKDYSSASNIIKPYKIKIILSMDFSLLRTIKNNIFKTIEESESDNILYDSLINEILNIIIGNSTRILSIIGEPITFEIPQIYNHSLKSTPTPSGWQVDFLTSTGNFRIYYLYNSEITASARKNYETNIILPDIYGILPA
jgi:hypothetical protein